MCAARKIINSLIFNMMHLRHFLYLGTPKTATDGYNSR